MKPTRTAGKSALQRNPQDPAFGLVDQMRHRAIDRKRQQSLVLKLKLHDRLRVTSPPEKQKLKLHRRLAKTKPSRPRLKILIEILSVSQRRPTILYFSLRCQTPFQS